LVVVEGGDTNGEVLLEECDLSLCGDVDILVIFEVSIDSCFVEGVSTTG
jgi:hypothetical protein